MSEYFAFIAIPMSADYTCTPTGHPLLSVSGGIMGGCCPSMIPCLGLTVHRLRVFTYGFCLLVSSGINLAYLWVAKLYFLDASFY